MSTAPISAAEVNPNLVRCALLRIAVGLLSILTLWDYGELLTLHFSSRGWLPPYVSASTTSSSLIELFTPQVTRGAFWLCLVSSLFLMIGLRARTAGVLTLLGLYAIQLRNSFLTDADDEILRSTLVVLLFAPVSGFWSLDAATSDAHATAGRWPLRVIRLKLAFLYLASGAEKLVGDSWHEGTAILLSLTNPAYARFQTPSGLESALAVLTPVVPYFELVLPLLLLPQATRTFGVALGIAFHVTLACVLELRWLSALVLAHYFAFLGDRQTLWLIQLLQRFKRIPLLTRG